ncbi:MAG: hypothetical protein OEV91_11050, partial [Desulfobulbaceae bacterium]|nr:hypothetical protein [Desulfobulbaceae bacterium]
RESWGISPLLAMKDDITKNIWRRKTFGLHYCRPTSVIWSTESIATIQNLSPAMRMKIKQHRPTAHEVSTLFFSLFKCKIGLAVAGSRPIF